jgi:hypothetical protein
LVFWHTFSMHFISNEAKLYWYRVDVGIPFSSFFAGLWFVSKVLRLPRQVRPDCYGDLVDQELVRNGRAPIEPWKFYDLGHGYCTYDFFDQCPHRMACAKCSFYLLKGSTKAQLLEAKANLLRLRQDIPLVDAELSAVEEGLAAYEQLLAKLADVPTPAGPTPRQLGRKYLVQLQKE